jgi:HTH-type transcriptional regulator, cell division transcriptional repressor
METPNDQTPDNQWCSEAASTYGDRITWAREASGLTASDMARRLGVRLTTVQTWEADRAEPRANRLQMMAGMLNVSLRWLLTGEGDGLDAPPGDVVVHIDDRALLAEMANLRTQLLALSMQAQRLEQRLQNMIVRDAA